MVEPLKNYQSLFSIAVDTSSLAMTWGLPLPSSVNIGSLHMKQPSSFANLSPPWNLYTKEF